MVIIISKPNLHCFKLSMNLNNYYILTFKSNGLLGFPSKMQPCSLDTSFCNSSHLTAVCILSGAGPHPKALSGRLVSAIWWLFAVMLLACYFGNFNSMLHSNSKHVSIKSFEDLANQDVINYGTVDAGSTMLFFKARPAAPN